MTGTTKYLVSLPYNVNADIGFQVEVENKQDSLIGNCLTDDSC